MSLLNELTDNASFDRLVIVSNRLPITVSKEKKTGHWQYNQSVGGLVTALTSVLENKKGMWIGWPGITEEADLSGLLDQASDELGYLLKSITLNKEEVDLYYHGFSNEVMWPLFHDIQSNCNFDPAYWYEYQVANERFARTIAENITENDYIWVQDYHLVLVAKELRRLGVTNKIGFFLHIPFASPDAFVRMPWRVQILEALLQYDLLGFQTPRDRNNFVYCTEAVLKGLKVDTRRQVATIKTDDRQIQVGSFPISIDFKDFAGVSASPEVTGLASQLTRAMHNRCILLGVDRLDYSKGIPEKLRAFRNALERYDDLHNKVALVQIVVPSREDIPGYRSLLTEIEGLVGEINGEFSQPGWVPVQYMFRNFERSEILAYYRTASVALVTPLKDGMNLVAKEYCAAHVDNKGILILSEFAGAAIQLWKNALLVNPYDIEGIADAIYRAYNMDADEQTWRMRKMRRSIARRDVYWWVDSFLQTAISG
ncbi:MAG: trehalose-6-phosphate synthase [Chloroflexi bacterium]|jgi:alpha,alpha-trehalose-phosphate synthase [UDP-forming]|nr:trehalose-6-phosphate synthase [Chloroflexota bacterium]MBT7081395.1 trehalose-6-phosphate synthase [Chloroflexota bacterium]MBT7290425.1 trehalose-6-phosphate synthase [Chloroflexota bacterium]